MIFVTGKKELPFAPYAGQIKSGDTVVVGDELPAYEARAICEKVKSEGGTTFVFAPPVLSPRLAMYCDFLLITGEGIQDITSIAPQGEAYTCLAIKKLYELGVKNVVVFLGEETVFAYGQTVTYLEELSFSDAIKRCVEQRK